MPAHLGISHVSLSVRDLARSERWYRDVPGFDTFERPPGAGWSEVVMLHRAAGRVRCLQAHDANRSEEFDPVRTGGDHLAFRAGTREALDAWQAFLAGQGVRHWPVVDRSYGAVLCLRDPDGIQLELFWRENHP
ncbi:glyoxalase [Longimycelium tulufanense]|uniref:Glyoxalase n=1 Tax=Longimycelium tulufanense TaxID=907463 RepID=A0A8J3FZB8_9PSEU|nr:VOC family protein [Longimycelium tulufanense]GGM78944.1 glyoxalase [Longimycelium tulufanense]